MRLARNPIPAPLPLLAVLAAAGCSSDTGRSRVDFDVELQGVRSEGTITTDDGWSVTLTEARLYVGAVYFFEGEPLFARRRAEALPLELARWLFTIPEASAHPGHYVEGEALADMLAANTVDLLGPAVTLGRANGVTGSYNSLRLELGRSDALSGHTALVAGRAEKGGLVVEFTGTVDRDAPIAGVAFGAEIEASDGKAHIDVDLAEWVRRIDFAAVPRAPGEVSPLQVGTQAHNALTRGVENTSAFHLSWVRAGGE